MKLTSVGRIGTILAVSDASSIGAALGAVSLAVSVVALTAGVLAYARGAPAALVRVAEHAAARVADLEDAYAVQRTHVGQVLEEIESEREEVRRQRRRLSASESRTVPPNGGPEGQPDPNDREAYAAWLMRTRAPGGIAGIGG